MLEPNPKGKADSLQSKASGPIWPGGCLESRPQTGVLLALELVLPLRLDMETNAQPCPKLNMAFGPLNQGTYTEHTGSCVFHPTAALTVTFEQRTQPVDFTVCKQNWWPFLVREFSEHVTVNKNFILHCPTIKWN